MQKHSVFTSIKTYLLFSLIFLFPLFFLPLTQDFFSTNKLYLLSFAALLLLSTSTVEFLVTRQFVWQKKTLDIPVVTFVVALLISLIISSPNKIQALYNVNFGLVQIVSLSILYFYLSRLEEKVRAYMINALLISSSVLSALTILFSTPILKAVSLPNYWSFLKSPNFSPIGSGIDLLVFLGISVTLLSLRLVTTESASSSKKTAISNLVFFILNSTALLIVAYTIIKSLFVTKILILPPFNISWYAAIEILKTPLTAVFGTGIDNYASIFTRVKDLLYNQTPNWQINTFNISSSTLLHIETESGIFGLITFLVILFSVFSKLSSFSRLHKGAQKLSLPSIIFFICSVLALIILPPSIITMFLFFLALGMIVSETDLFGHSQIQIFDISGLLPIYLGTAIVLFLFIGGSGYLLGKSYLAEYYFKQSFEGVVQNNIKTLYDNQRTAAITNPYIERFRTNFSQTNLLVANNIASKIQSQTAKDQNQTSLPQLSEQDRQTISQAIQAAISEAKAAVALNPQKANNWESLANTYRNIINVAQGADVWTISAYQRAIVIDPQNPIYRLNLGGVYYSLNNWEEASKLFEQAVGLKVDWANAHYNLAWSLYQKKDYVRATNEMQNALSLLDTSASKTDYERAQKELEEFKSKLPQTTTTDTPASSEATIKEPQLTLPTKAPEIEPKIKLPETASPEAR